MDQEPTATAHDFAVARDGDATYRLTGTVTATSTGWTVDVHPVSDGVVAEARLARFLVHAIAPDPDDVVQPTETDLPVDHAFEDDAALETVVVHLQGATTADGGAVLELSIG